MDILTQNILDEKIFLNNLFEYDLFINVSNNTSNQSITCRHSKDDYNLLPKTIKDAFTPELLKLYIQSQIIDNPSNYKKIYIKIKISYDHKIDKYEFNGDWNDKKVINCDLQTIEELKQLFDL